MLSRVLRSYRQRAPAVQEADVQNSSSSSSSSRSSAPGGSSSDSSGDSPDEVCELEEKRDDDAAALALRRARTDAARRALASTRYEKLKQKLEEKQPETKTRAEILQEHLFSKEFYAQDRGGNMRSETRLRGIFSYFRAFVNAVHSLFVSPAKHILGICIVDDTNIQMAEPGGATAVYSAMNAIQTVSLRSGTDRHLHFRVHQPMVCLANATAATLHRHATAWFFLWCRGVG